MYASKVGLPLFVFAVALSWGCGNGEQAPTITLVSPNGGGYWVVGSTETVNWSSTGTLSNVKIELSTDGGTGWTTLVASTANDGSDTVTVPNSPSIQCRVRVGDIDGSPADTSGADFEIGPAYIQVVSPNGGETLNGAEQHLIEWDSQGVSGDVVVKYSRDEGMYLETDIDTVPASDGSYLWTMPDIDNIECRVIVVDALPSGLIDQSDNYFTIARKPIRVLSPNGGEALVATGNSTISWVINGVTGNVDIHYSIDSGSTFPNLIATVPADDLSYAWTVPAESSTQCRIRVQEAGGGNNDMSDSDFSIGSGSGGWAAMDNTSAPGPGWAFWTGSKMLVWTGDAGGIYDPVGDSWTSIDLTGAPVARQNVSVVWTGTQMIVWGGEEFDGMNWVQLDTGAAYTPPPTDSWTATGTLGTVPAARAYHSAVWTGTEMIVWGGWYDDGMSSGYFNSGGVYDPLTGSWSPTDIANAPTARSGHTAVWTGTEMIVWGGAEIGGLTKTGGRYEPGSDLWVDTPTNGAPSGRKQHTAVWAGSKMVIWGGNISPFMPSPQILVDSGGCYDPAGDSWTSTSVSGAPSARVSHAVVSTGTEMIIWSGGDLLSDWGAVLGDTNAGAVYNVASDSWSAITATGAPSQRYGAAAVWTGTTMIVWGGWHWDGMALNTYSNGAIYTP